MFYKFILAYATIDIFSIIFAITVLAKVNNTIGNESENRIFKSLIISYITFVLTDLWWVMCNYSIIPTTQNLTAIISCINMTCVAFTAYYWFMYAEIRMNPKYIDSSTFKILVKFPLILMVALYTSSLKTGTIFKVSETGEFIHGKYYFLPIFIDDSYLVYVTIHAIIKAYKEKSSSKKKEYHALINFVVFPMICGIIDYLIPDVPVMALSIFSSIFFVFVSNQESKIYNDSLTGLNNRRRWHEYMERVQDRLSVEEPLIVYLLDINYFKDINDTQGHAEGDHALQIVANALKHLSEEYRMFPCRVGGDEFILAGCKNKIQDEEDFIDEICNQIMEESKREHIKYEISVSAGYGVCKDRNTPIEEVVKLADEMLYINKEIIHKQILNKARIVS